MPTLAYCFTLNNYSPDDVSVLYTPNEHITYLIGGHEIAPTTGTPHIQGYFQLAQEVNFTTMRNWGEPWNRMRFSAARGSDIDNYNYCSKEGDFFEVGTRRSIPKAVQSRKGQTALRVTAAAAAEAAAQSATAQEPPPPLDGSRWVVPGLVTVLDLEHLEEVHAHPAPHSILSSIVDRNWKQAQEVGRGGGANVPRQKQLEGKK